MAIVTNEMSERDAEDALSHSVSTPLASSPTVFVVPTVHAVHTLDLTYSLTAHLVASQVVSAPLASSPRAFVDPAAHAVHTLVETYSLIAHKVASHNVYGEVNASDMEAVAL